MKTPLLMIVAVIALTSCNTNSSNESEESSSSGVGFSSSRYEIGDIPQWDERVVAYKEGGNGEPYSVITDIDVLKNIFKIALSDENLNPQCDYFVISVLIGDGLTYLTVSKNIEVDHLIVNHIYPNATLDSDGLCRYPATISSHAVLVCDKQGGLKEKVYFPPAKFNDPTWDCTASVRDRPFFEH